MAQLCKRLSIAILFLVWGLSFFPQALSGQTLNGDARDLGNGCYQLNRDSMWTVGSLFFPDTLNLNRPFNMLMEINFGTRDLGGADGVVFILQNNSATELGAAGGSLGYFGISNSIGVEFDTYENIPEADPFNDHIALMRDGSIAHNSPQNLAGPVSANANNADIENGADHLVQIKWNPANFSLDVYFDCDLRLSHTIDLVNTIFGGDSLVYWGFSAASGGAFNGHTVCLVEPVGGVLDSLGICQGDTASFMAGPSQDGVYLWEPAYNASGTVSQTIDVWPEVDTTYTCRYLDPCGIPTVDTFEVQYTSPDKPDLGNDTTFCTGLTYVLDPGLSGVNFNWSTGSSADTLAVDSAGTFILEVSDASGCFLSDTVEVDFVAPPTVTSSPDTTICGSDSGYTLTVLPIAFATDYVWSNGDTATSLHVTETGVYTVEAINSCSTATDSTEVTFFKYEEGYFIPNVFTPNGDSFNDTYLIENVDPEDFKLQIFDRWGREVYHSLDRDEGWNGTQSGTSVKPGIYFYLVRTRDCQQEIVKKKACSV